MHVARLGLIAGLVMSLVLGALVFGPWIKMKVGMKAEVEMELVSMVQEGTSVFVTYRAHNSGDTGPVELIRTVRYNNQQWQAKTLVLSFAGGSEMERKDVFVGIPPQIPVSSLDVELSARPRWIPFRW